MFWRKKRTPTYTRNQILSTRPLRNPLVRWEEQEDGLLLLRVPLRRKGFWSFLSRIFPLPDEHKVELDELGSTVWELCDGKHTVDAILQRMVRLYKFDRREAEVRLFEFLNILSRRRYIAFLRVKKR